jgi:CheY-like chemotaxis protein
VALPRAIVVDDDPGFAKFVRKVAVRCGYEVAVARDGAAFQAEYAVRQPDVILLDLQMPGTDGVEFLRILAELGCTASILVMSGFDTKVVETARRIGSARGLRMGCVLTKPILANDLRDVLNDLKPASEAPVELSSSHRSGGGG